MKRRILSLVVVSFLVWAGTTRGTPDEQKEGQRREQEQKRRRGLLVAAFAEGLNLSEEKILEFLKILRELSSRQKPYQDELAEANKIVKRASEGDPSAEAQLEGAIQRHFAARQAMAANRQQALARLTEGMTAQQKAQIMMIWARFDADWSHAQREKRFKNPPKPQN